MQDCGVTVFGGILLSSLRSVGSQGLDAMNQLPDAEGLAEPAASNPHAKP